MKRNGTLIKISIVLFVLVFIVSFAQIIMTRLQYKQADETYDKIREKYLETLPTDDATDDVAESESTDTESLRQNFLPIRVDFNTLLRDNEDVVGWIYAEGTPINYPVVQSSDNNYYLRRDMNGEYLVSGTIFLDYRCGSPGENRNHLIYGHNMKNETMFGTLVKYKDEAYYKAHPELYYLTPKAEYKIRLVAGLVVSNNEIIYKSDPSDDEMKAFLNTAMAKSTFVSGEVFEDEDILVTLSTCSYEFDSARYVLLGKLIAIE